MKNIAKVGFCSDIYRSAGSGFISARNTMEKNQLGIYIHGKNRLCRWFITNWVVRRNQLSAWIHAGHGESGSQESISVLPEDCGLYIRDSGVWKHRYRISYEVRNSTIPWTGWWRERKVEDWDSGDGSVSGARIHKNLLARNETILLSITVHG